MCVFVDGWMCGCGWVGVGVGEGGGAVLSSCVAYLYASNCVSMSESVIFFLLLQAEESLHLVSAAMAGFAPRHQAALTAPYVDRFFAEVSQQVTATNGCIFVCLCGCSFAFMCPAAFTCWVCMCVCMHVCGCVCVCVCVCDRSCPCLTTVPATTPPTCTAT